MRAEKDISDIEVKAVLLAEQAYAEGARTFKVEARRTDKGFPLTSMDIAKHLGAHILSVCTGFSVDVHKSDFILYVEIREEAWLYGKEVRGERGLPVSSSGRALLLLSGGIDSPVAGYLMAKRGLSLDAIYFHAWPYTADEAEEKVFELAGILSKWLPRLNLFVISFTEVQETIKNNCPPAWTTLITRMAMVDTASRIASRHRSRALITGESLGQVASQTLENLRVTESCSRYSILRPLIGMDKEEIIEIAKRINTYETSILPYEDCCLLFSPKHPIIHANFDEAQKIWKDADLGEKIHTAIANRKRIVFSGGKRSIKEGGEKSD